MLGWSRAVSRVALQAPTCTAKGMYVFFLLRDTPLRRNFGEIQGNYLLGWSVALARVARHASGANIHGQKGMMRSPFSAALHSGGTSEFITERSV